MYLAKPLVRCVGHAQSVMGIAWSPDGRRLATGSLDCTVRIWDSETGRELGVIGRHDRPVMGVRFIEGGKTLASISNEGTLKLWLTENRR